MIERDGAMISAQKIEGLFTVYRFRGVKYIEGVLIGTWRALNRVIRQFSLPGPDVLPCLL